MFDLGMMELLVIGIVALIVVGPKDLPGLFRTVGNFVGKLKGMAREFQRSMDAAAKESGVDDAMDGVKSAASGLKKATDFNPMAFNKDLKSMTKDAINKNGLLSDKAKAARLAKIEAEADADPGARAEDAPVAQPLKTEATKDEALKQPVAKKAPAKKPDAKKPAAKKEA